MFFVKHAQKRGIVIVQEEDDLFKLERTSTKSKKPSGSSKQKQPRDDGG